MAFSEDTQQLLAQVNSIYPGSIVLRGADQASGILTHEQVSTDTLGTRLMIEVNDATALDFSATYELLGMMLKLSGYPQLYFQLDAQDESLTEQRMVMASYLYQPALNAIIYREQAKHGLLTAEVAEAFAKGVMKTLTRENDEDNSEAALRLLTLLDARVFMANVASDTQHLTDTFNDAFPKAWTAAGMLVDQMLIDQIVDPASLHRGVVSAFKGFDAQMLAWGLPELDNMEFATLTPVLSERQLRLSVSQVFEIKHTTFKNHANGEDAYVALAKNDGQNSFVIVPAAENQAEWFKELYQTPVKDLLDAMGQPYVVRD
jgi:hypothetical protein